MRDFVYITRDARERIGEVSRTGRVYVTGPWFGQDIFSSTDDPAGEGTLFDRAEAERLLALGKWRGAAPRIEELDQPDRGEGR